MSCDELEIVDEDKLRTKPNPPNSVLVKLNKRAKQCTNNGNAWLSRVVPVPSRPVTVHDRYKH